MLRIHLINSIIWEKQLSLNIKVLFAVILSVYNTDSTRLDLPLIEVRKIAQSQIVRKSFEETRNDILGLTFGGYFLAGKISMAVRITLICQSWVATRETLKNKIWLLRTKEKRSQLNSRNNRMMICTAWRG